jgi:nucleotide-binding universal stress UspA family protein
MTTSQKQGSRVVVGVDGSGGSKRALVWAVATAKSAQAPVVAVYAYRTMGDPYGGSYGPSPVHVYNQLRHAAEQDLSGELTDVLGGEGVPSLTQVVAPGSPDEVLIEQSHGAALLVVGGQGHSRDTHLGLGSAAEDVIRHAPCPVVVVREKSATDPGPEAGRVVIAISESAHTPATLEFGFRFASHEGLPVTVLHVWDNPLFHRAGRAAPVFDPDTIDELEKAEREALAAAVTGMSTKFPDVKVREDAALGDKTTTVLRASAGAALLVVGAHQRTIPGSLALGAVTHAAVHRGYCPVAVVPA